MPISLIALFVASIAAIVFITGRCKGHPFAALLMVGFGYGLAADLSVGYTIKSMIDGFAIALAASGLAVLAAALLGTLLQRLITDPPEPLGRRPQRGLPASVFAAGLGLAGGLAQSVEMALALLLPVVGAKARRRGRQPGTSMLCLTLVLLATSVLVLPAPAAVAAARILDADFGRVLPLGLGLALVLSAVGWLFAILIKGTTPDEAAGAPSLAAAAPAGPRVPRSSGGLVLIVGTPIVVMIASAVAWLPSTPFGEGTTRDILVTAGRPVVPLLLVLALGGALLALRAHRYPGLSRSWVGGSLSAGAGLLATVGAAGAFAEVLQNAGLGDKATDLLAGGASWTGAAGLLLPLALSAIVKVAQGSSAVAIITAAAITEPMLAPLGLDSATGRAFAAVATGAGALLLPHLNDPAFWITCGFAGWSPVRGLRLLTLGALAQAATAVAMLLCVAALLL